MKKSKIIHDLTINYMKSKDIFLKGKDEADITRKYFEIYKGFYNLYSNIDYLENMNLKGIEND